MRPYSSSSLAIPRLRIFWLPPSSTPTCRVLGSKVSDGWAPRPENGERQMSAVSAVLPLKAYGRRYIDDPGRCHILLTSLATFAPDDMFEEIFVVVPARERAHAEALRRDWQSLPLVVIDEEEILPAFRDHPLTLNAGWYRQQLIKLCAANLSKTEFFITFDSDVILTKPICVADIVRALEQGDPFG